MKNTQFKKVFLSLAIAGLVSASGAAYANSVEVKGAESNDVVNKLLNVENIQEIEKNVDKDAKNRSSELIYDSKKSIDNSNKLSSLQEEAELLEAQIKVTEKQNILNEKKEASKLKAEIEKNKKLTEEISQLNALISELEDQNDSLKSSLSASEQRVYALEQAAKKKEAGEDFFAKVSVNRLYGINNNLKADLVYDNHIITRKEGQEIANGLILTKINEDNIVVKKGTTSKTIFISVYDKDN